jgi:drug/metabolite transporter (DMT)-like permease
MSALWFGGETLTPMGWAGGALIAIAALVEAVDSGRTPAPATMTETTGG